MSGTDGFLIGYFVGVVVTFLSGWFGLKVLHFELIIRRKPKP